MTTSNVANIKFSTNVELKDKDTGEILVSKSNSIHPQNLAFVIARGLANQPDHNIHLVALGNGGTFIDTAGIIRFNNPITTGTDAKLYNQTYFEVVDGTVVIPGNSLTSAGPNPDTTTSLITVEMVIAPDEPAGQWLTDAEGVNDPSNPSAGGYQFEFDELGCFAKNVNYDPLNPSAGPEYLLLTHIIFQPIAKSQNRQIQLTYSITVSVS